MIKIGTWVEITAGPYRGERGQVTHKVPLYGEPVFGWQVQCPVPGGLTCNRRRKPAMVMCRNVRASDLRELRV